MGSRERYFKRLQIAKNHALGAKWLVGRVVLEDGDISAEHTEVLLKKFANWMVNETTLDAFPNEFSRLAESNTGVTTTKSNHLIKDWTQRSAKEFIEEKRKAGSFTAAGALHGVKRQRYTEVYKKVTEREGK
jgi:hypothetical protein